MIAEIISSIAIAVTISGVTLKDLISKSKANKADIKAYIKFLEVKQVLNAPFEQEVLPAVIKSIEEIKQETEKLRVNINDDHASLILLHLVLKMSEELMVLHNLDYNDPKHNIKMYKSIQEVRSKFSKALVLLSAAFDIDLTKSNLLPIVLDMNFKPRSK
ncbi:MAG: hypothetical protein H9917_01315 [Candidatus Oceanisphaera merdipullorum]|nr:hypothetical protein [Candidatus Oceanisphaera merdipullorum]